MSLKFNNGDKVKFPSEINGEVWEVLECVNIQEWNASSFEEKFAMQIIPNYRCKTIDHYGKEVINNIAENLIERVN